MAAALRLNVVYGALRFLDGIQNQHFESTRQVTKKSTLCTVLIMLTIPDDPLTTFIFFAMYSCGAFCNNVYILRHIRL